MDASSLRVLQDLCSQKGIATSGDESFTDLMDMLRGSVATKPKAASKADSKSAVPSTDHDEDDGGVEDKEEVEEEEEEDAGFDVFLPPVSPTMTRSCLRRHAIGTSTSSQKSRSLQAQASPTLLLLLSRLLRPAARRSSCQVSFPTHTPPATA